MEQEMFCYQCEQTAGGKGCTKIGVCGKSAEVANLQDLLIFQLKGISCYAYELIKKGQIIDQEDITFVENCLFMTLTNVNFDIENHIALLRKSQSLKERYRLLAQSNRTEAVYNLPSAKEDYFHQTSIAGLMAGDVNEDIRSIRHTIQYGLKGISAYGHQARVIGFNKREIDEFYFYALEAITDDTLTLENLIEVLMKTGTCALKVMELLDEANTTRYKHPKPVSVNTNIKKGPFIIVSGHDLNDLEMILKQTEGKGINIYTHGEMLPCHGYPDLKKYKHLIGNFGGAWQDQQKEFDNLPGSIILTTNCLMKPRDSYRDRIFTTNVVGYDNVKHIEKNEKGEKDYREAINKALELGGFKDDEVEHNILVGFGHNATLSYADKIISAVKNGALRHFFLIGGCDGARTGRNYYTEFAKEVPSDCIILTLACGKYRFNKLAFGEVAGLPRLLDVGQCNDVYSAVKIATALANAFETSVNDLPLSLIVSWYEQKAVADLLALLSLGIKRIFLGPTLPAFLSPNVLQFLVENFDIRPISTPKDDLKLCLDRV